MKDDELLALSDAAFEAEMDRQMDAVSTVYSLRPGHTLTQADFEAIQLHDKVYRDNDERAADAFHRGYMQGLREGGSADIEEMRKKLDAQFIDHGVDKAMRWMAEERAVKLTADIRDFIHALDRGYLDCKDDSAFIDALRAHVPAVSSAASGANPPASAPSARNEEAVAGTGEGG